MPISKEIINQQRIIDAQNHAARLAMLVSGVDYDSRAIDGGLDRPVDAAIRLVAQGAINGDGLELLIEAGVIADK